MAAVTKVVLGSSRTVCNVKHVFASTSTVRNASWSRYFRRTKKEQDKEEELSIRKTNKWDGPSTVSRLVSLNKKVSVHSVRGYTPPTNVEQTVVSSASKLVGAAVGRSFRLDDRLVKFKLLTQLMDEFDHPIPNTELSTMNTIQDAVNFFSTPVQDRSTFDDMAKLNLPKNLHIQLEPVRFDPETDTFFDGKTAFPGRPTIVTSLKYGRKYKGNSGESRNERSVTKFEYRKQLQEDYEKLGLKFK